VSAARRKGTQAETAVVRALRDAGFIHAERRALSGAADRGDIAGIPGLVIEVKNHRRDRLSEWVTEVDAERTRDNARYGVVWHKRPGTTDPVSWYVTMTGENFLRLLADALDLDTEGVA